MRARRYPLSTRLRVLLVDDHDASRELTRTVLAADPGLEVVGEAEDGRQALDLVERTAPDLAVLDITLPGMSGLDVACDIVARFPAVGLVVLSAHNEQQYVVEALRCGVRAYVLKETVTTDLMTAIECVLAGDHFISPVLARGVQLDRLEGALEDALDDARRGGARSSGLRYG